MNNLLLGLFVFIGIMAVLGVILLGKWAELKLTQYFYKGKTTMYYRWYVVNNQNTCFLDIVELVPGWHANKEEAKEYMSYKYNFEECCFGVRVIEESGIPIEFVDLVKRTGKK